MMHMFKLKPDLMEKISAVQQELKWKPNMMLHIVDSKEQVKEEEEADRSRVKVHIDGSGYKGQVEMAVVLYQDGEVRSRRRLRLGSMWHHTIYIQEGGGRDDLRFGANQRGVVCKWNDTNGS